jgi:hypothetical protein
VTACREAIATIVRRGAALAALCAAGGCVSYSYVDADHVQHIVGFVDVTAPAAGDGQTTSLTTTTLGVALYRRPQSNVGLTLGYNKETLVSLPSGACIDLNTAGVCAGAPPPNPKP